ncbi:MAG TPA: TraR/DksA C4-type zinc finger protein [Chitinophagaceae bacterium]|nr:TraR/DksA C4-type zinc finger protein [Chitinophagaceae bacterium]
MATKKKPASKKASKPVKKAAPKKRAPKKVAPKKAAKPAAKKPASQKPAKVAAKKPVEKTKAADKKPSAQENKSLVSVKPQIKPIVKKEPPKPVKVVIPKTSTKSVKKYEPEFTKSVLDAQEQDAGAPSMRYSDTELTEFREIIMKKLDAAKKELNYLQGLITRKDESGDMDEGRYMTMEDGSVSMEREQLSQMASRQITFIDHLEKALMRIENKTYGICRVTGKLIDKARLRAVPHATLSIEAKQMMNK